MIVLYSIFDSNAKGIILWLHHQKIVTNVVYSRQIFTNRLTS